MQFFINGIKTHTSGLDLVANYKNIRAGRGEIDLNFAGNYTLENKIIGNPKNPQAFIDAGTNIMNAQTTSLLTESRPKYKAVFGVDYRISKLSFSLNNTFFGKTKFQDLDNGVSYKSMNILLNPSDINDPLNSRNAMNDMKQVFSPAVLTDLNTSYELTKKLNLSFTINNIFNVLPKWDLVALNSNGQKAIDDTQAKDLLKGFLMFSGRYRILGYNGSQFSQLGTMFSASLRMSF